MFRFGSFELDPQARQLRAAGQPVALGARAFDVLLALLERRDRLVAKHELLDVVWRGRVVEENNLQVQISTLRRVLGPRAIATIPGRGYRFTAALADASGRDAAAPAAPLRALPAGGAPAPPPAPPTNLPAEMPPLFGRDDDVAAVVALVGSHRLVTIVGAGGIGKSRLAQAAAHALIGPSADGAWLVELAGLADPALVPQAVAQPLGIALAGRAPAGEELVAGIAARSLLLVLDNCEHLLDATVALVQALLAAAPGVRILATSQEPLRLPSEQQYRVTPLAIEPGSPAHGAADPGALALLEARVRAVDPRFALGADNRALAIDICRRLDGLPLAIELAAPRVATLGLRPVRDKLDERFRLLTGGSRAALRRHQTLRAALEWSHNLLTEPEQVVFRRLGVFAGGFTMEIAQSVAADATLDGWAVLDHLSALVDKSLVVADPGDPPRYRLLESARAFALERLAAVETDATLRRHAQALRELIERVDAANLDGELRTDQYAALLLPEMDNLRAAQAWASGPAGDRGIACALAVHSGSLIDYAPECAEWLLAVQRSNAAATLAPAVATRYWRALAAGNMSGHLPRTLQIEAAIRARDGYEALGQPRRVFSSLIQLARHRWAQRQDRDAAEATEAARRLLRPDWPPEFQIRLLRMDSYVAQSTGRFDEALALYREGVRVSAASGDWRLEVIARSNLVNALWQQGRLDEAADGARRLAAELLARPAADSEMALHFANTVGLLSEMGRLDEAAALAAPAFALMRRAGAYYVEEWIHLFWRRDLAAIATRLLGASDAQRTQSGIPLQANEQRLVDAARPALAAARSPGVYAGDLAAGAALDKAGVVALIAEGVAALR